LVMGTYAELMLSEKNEVKAAAACASAWKEIGRLEKMFSFHDPESELSRINAEADKHPVRMSDEMAEVMNKALWANRVSDGTFDVTVGTLSKLYGFYRESKKRVPSDSEIQTALTHIGSRYLIYNPDDQTIVYKKKGLVVDLGGLAKGYVVDKAVAILKGEGIRSGMVNIGGNMYGFGDTTWKIGIQHPRESGAILDTILLKNQGVATSGDYERFFITNHLRVHHIFNPQTGRSATRHIGVTILASSAFLADIFSTSLFISEEKRAEALAHLHHLTVWLVTQSPSKEIVIIHKSGNP